MGENLAEHLIVALVLSSLPDSYSALITALESRGEDNLKLDYVKGQLLDEWRRRCDSSSGGNVPVEKVLKTGAKSGAKPKLYHYCKQQEHFRRDCPKFTADQAKKQGALSTKSSRKQKCVKKKNLVNFVLLLVIVTMTVSGTWTPEPVLI